MTALFPKIVNAKIKPRISTTWEFGSNISTFSKLNITINNNTRSGFCSKLVLKTAGSINSVILTFWLLILKNIAFDLNTTLQLRGNKKFIHFKNDNVFAFHF